MTSENGSMYEFLVPMSKENAGLHRIGMHVSLTGKNMQMTYIYMPAHAEVGWHSHEQESFVTVVRGGYELWVDEEYFVLKPGWACWVPANTLHRARVGPEDTIEIEVFAPPREDWAAISPTYDFRERKMQP